MISRLRLRRLGPVALAGLTLAGLLSGCKIPGQQPGGGYHLTAYFPKAVSLYKGSSVRILGLDSGTVTAVKVEGDRVQVQMSMAKSAVLPQGVKATLVPQSLLGERYVQLYPAWVAGQPRLDPRDRSQTVIGLDRTSIPVEPDEALAALKRLLDDLDPSATGRLITNLNDDLQGNGQNLNNTIKGLATLTNTLGDKDKQLAGMIDNFAQFTTTIETRESQLGRVMDLFAQTTSLLAQERGTIASLIHHLGSTASNALDLVSKHGPALETDVKTLNVLLSSLDANLGSVSALLSSGPVLVAGQNLDSKSGLVAAYDPAFRRINLRANIPETVNQLLQALGINICVPGPGATCPQVSSPAPGQAGATTTTTTTSPTTAPPVTLPPVGGPGPTTTTTTLLPPITLPPPPAATRASTTAASPLSPVMALLGSQGATGPIEPSAYGLAEPAPTPHHGVLATVARWSHIVLDALW